MKRSLHTAGQDIPLDKEGYLEHLDDWSPAVASLLAAEHGITLDQAHWEIIDLLRQFHAEHEISPAMRILVRLVKKELGEEKGNSLYLLGLFPDSPAKLACRIAGLPRPANCL